MTSFPINSKASAPEADSAASEPTVAVDLLRISELARKRLAQISRSQPTDCTESYLFEDDFFCGLRFYSGPFVARWLINEDVIRFFRESQPIGLIELNPDSAQAA